MTFSPLGTNNVRAEYMDFIYSFWTAYTTVVYRKPNAESKVKIYVKPFKYQVKLHVSLGLCYLIWKQLIASQLQQTTFEGKCSQKNFRSQN